MDKKKVETTLSDKSKFVVHDDKPAVMPTLQANSVADETVSNDLASSDEHAYIEPLVWSDDNRREFARVERKLEASIADSTPENMSLTQGLILSNALMFGLIFWFWIFAGIGLNIHFLIQDGHLRSSFLGGFPTLWIPLSLLGSLPLLSMAADRVEIKWGKFGLGQNCRLLLSRLCKRGLAPLYKNEALVECSQGFIERGKFVEARSTLTYYPFRFSGEDPGFKLICDAH